MMLIQQGNRLACQELVNAHLPALSRFATRLLGNVSEAEDAVQDTFLKVWTHAYRWQPGKAKVTTWLHKVAHNTCIDRMRKARAATQTELSDDLPSPDSGLDDQLSWSSQAQKVFACLSLLPEQQRTAVVLCHYQGFSNKEAAEILDVSVDALESLLARGRRKLKQLLVPLPHPQHSQGESP
jgi:RNA polymerase sigma-70 factor (ECF subfamily)